MEKSNAEILAELDAKVDNSDVLSPGMKAFYRDYNRHKLGDGKARIAGPPKIRQHSRRLLNPEPTTPIQRKERASACFVKRHQLLMSEDQENSWKADAILKGLSLNEWLRLAGDTLIKG
jgi:hypothetical protein